MGSARWGARSPVDVKSDALGTAPFLYLSDEAKAREREPWPSSEPELVEGRRGALRGLI